MPKKILLADDSITIQKVVELTFSDGDYEVTAVNNGAKAIAKLGEMRPDIILSDIIMPEKNGYEVCEFVKSHPDYRTIPVILLTGTFEPFDPDRADKAGCDAVVTKPFESQSLIHKVDELIEQSRPVAATAPAAAPPPVAAPPEEESAPAESPWMEDNTPTAKTPSPFASPEPAVPDPFARAHEIFGAPAAAPPPPETPFSEPEPPAFSGETRAFQKMSFTDLQASTQQVSSTPPPPPTEAASPWDEEPAAPPPPPPAPIDESPFGAPPPADMFSSETRAVPKMSLEELQQMANTSAAAPPPPEPEPEPSATPSPWDEQPPAFSGETRAFPKMTFDQLESAASSAPMPGGASVWDEQPAPEAPAWAPPPEPEPPMPSIEPAAAEPAWSEPAPVEAAPVATTAGNGVDLSDEQVDRIARRVVQLMSDQVVRNIAWEVIPDLAEMVVKERIRQLESE